MSRIVLLDTGVLGNVTNPKAINSNNVDCLDWLISLPSRSYEVAIPEISDYELRRELLRANKFNGIRQLDLLKTQFIYIPISTETILLAAKSKLTDIFTRQNPDQIFPL